MNHLYVYQSFFLVGRLGNVEKSATSLKMFGALLYTIVETPESNKELMVGGKNRIHPMILDETN